MVVIMNTTAKASLLALFVLALTLPSAPLAADDSADSVKDCYTISGEARYGALGYKHVVIVSNRCSTALQCEVWTDVDPTPRLPLSVGPNGSAETICRIGSPARAFKAFGECKKKK